MGNSKFLFHLLQRTWFPWSTIPKHSSPSAYIRSASKSHRVATFCNSTGRCWISTLWKSAVPLKELWYGICIQRLCEKSCDGECGANEHAGSCQGVA